MGLFKEIYNYREMVATLVQRELRGRYKASVLGFLWTFINPLCQLLIYTIVFSVIMTNNTPKYYLFIFVALIPWNFCSTCLTGGSGCIIGQQAMITKIYFPREVIPIAYVTASFINMLYGYIVVFVVCLFSRVHFSILGLLCLPLVMLVEYCFVLGITMIFSALTVYLRDTEHILGIVSMGWMFMTPIMYSSDLVPASLMPIFKLNPMTSISESYRDIMYYGRVPNLRALGIVALCGIAIMVFGFWFFGKLKRRFAEEL